MINATISFLDNAMLSSIDFPVPTRYPVTVTFVSANEMYQYLCCYARYRRQNETEREKCITDVQPGKKCLVKAAADKGMPETVEEETTGRDHSQ